MKIGIPREVKILEGRVALIPAAADELVRSGHPVFIESQAGVISGFSDEQYSKVGVTVLPTAKALYDAATLIVKVKEPQPAEVALLRPDHILFSYLHLAAEPRLAQELCGIGLTAVAFETVQEADGSLPLLAPMSDIAGRIAAQVGTHYLHRPLGGKGILLGGLPAAERGRVVVIGAGVAGGNAARVAAGLGAEVIVFDRNRTKLMQMRDLGHNVTTLFAYDDAIKDAVLSADLVIGAVLITGERAPHVVSADTVRKMEPGSVIVDISVDQGGCIETTRPTTYDNPVYVWEGVTHFCVTNMPGAVPKTSTQAICAALLPYVQTLAQSNWRQNAALTAGVNVDGGKIVHPGLKRSLVK